MLIIAQENFLEKSSIFKLVKAKTLSLSLAITIQSTPSNSTLFTPTSILSVDMYMIKKIAV